VAREAALHLAIRPGTNVAVRNALLHELIANGWTDDDFIARHTVGYDELAAAVAE
jgi:ferredoxin-nitrate reductase